MFTSSVRRFIGQDKVLKIAVKQRRVNMHAVFHRFVVTEYATRPVDMRHALSPITRWAAKNL